MNERANSRVFGKTRKAHTIIFASDEKIRHITVRPWVAGLCVSFAGVMAIGYLAATSYLIFRDDLIGAAMAREARMQHAYEDRIAALRSQVDRATSRQLLDQAAMERKVSELMARQNALTSRHGRLDPLLERAGLTRAGLTGAGLTGVSLETTGIPSLPSGNIPIPTPRPDRQAALRKSVVAPSTTILPMPALAALNLPDPKPTPTAFAPGVDDIRADRIFSLVTKSLASIESEQTQKLQELAGNAYETANRITDLVRATGLPLAQVPEGATGGPYLKPGDPATFETSIEDLDTALDQLERVRRSARALPIAVPAPGAAMTSRFGNRKDPFMGRLAFHSGIDFRVKRGTPVHTAGAGTVISAGRNGGYGKMIEIDHGNGYTSRYAHLSKILVKKGDKVGFGDIIAKSGSTGRSTGPHLHYEVRHNGKAINPGKFLRTANKLRPLLVSL